MSFKYATANLLWPLRHTADHLSVSFSQLQEDYLFKFSFTIHVRNKSLLDGMDFMLYF